jgi:hypothetical protein
MCRGITRSDEGQGAREAGAEGRRADNPNDRSAAGARLFCQPVATAGTGQTGQAGQCQDQRLTAISPPRRSTGSRGVAAKDQLATAAGRAAAGSGANNCSSARLIVAWRIGAVIFAPIRSVM